MRWNPALAISATAVLLLALAAPVSGAAEVYTYTSRGGTLRGFFGADPFNPSVLEPNTVYRFTQIIASEFVGVDDGTPFEGPGGLVLTWRFFIDDAGHEVDLDYILGFFDSGTFRVSPTASQGSFTGTANGRECTLAPDLSESCEDVAIAASVELRAIGPVVISTDRGHEVLPGGMVSTGFGVSRSRDAVGGGSVSTSLGTIIDLSPTIYAQIEAGRGTGSFVIPKP